MDVDEALLSERVAATDALLPLVQQAMGAGKWVAYFLADDFVTGQTISTKNSTPAVQRPASTPFAKLR
jgi:hypothetical protein